MALRLRRGTNAERATRVFDLAEPVWVTDKQQLWIGNGTGSVDPIQSYAGTGLSYSYNGTNGGRLSVNLGALNTDQLPQGGTNKYFAKQLAQDAFAELIANGTQSNITFTYDPINHSLSTSIDVSAFLVSTDQTPTLGGDLDINGFDITGAGNINITGDITLDGSISVADFGAIVFQTNSTFNIYDSNDGGFPSINMSTSRGTVSSKVDTQPGDGVGGFKTFGFYNGVYLPCSAIVSVWEDDADLTNTTPKSKIILGTGDNNGGGNIASFDGSGVFTVPTLSASDGTASNPSITFATDGALDTGFFHPADGVVCISTNATERVRVDSGGLRVVGFAKVGGFATGSLPSPAEAGMIVLDTTTNEFKGYNGSAWVVLG